MSQVMYKGYMLLCTPEIDKPIWLKFLAKVRIEIDKRGKSLGGNK